MVRKSLHCAEDFSEIKIRLELLRPESDRKWGRMDAAQMLTHCAKVLQVASGEIVLPDIHYFLRFVGVTTKREMRLLNHGIPPNMPTFDLVKVNEKRNFDESKSLILSELDNFKKISKEKKFPASHPLFGQMNHRYWGFLQYKHIDHHLKQFGL